jgi:hypothetical protein
MLNESVQSVQLAPSFELTKMWEFDRENRWAVNMATPYTVGTTDAIGFLADSSGKPVKIRGAPNFRIPIRDSVVWRRPHGGRLGHPIVTTLHDP